VSGVNSAGDWFVNTYGAGGALLATSLRASGTNGLVQVAAVNPSLATDVVPLGWLQSASGAPNVGVQRADTGGGLRTIYARAREDMRVTDFYDGVSDANHPNSRMTGFNNTFDDTPYFQKASDAARALRETRIRMPRSFYRVASNGLSLTLRNGAEWIGDGHSEGGVMTGLTSSGTTFGEDASGTWIKSNSQTAKITNDGGWPRGGAFRNVAFVQDHAVPTSGWTPTTYANPIFDFQSMQGAFTFENVRFHAVYKAINSYLSGRLQLKNIQSQVFSSLLVVDRALDKIRVNGGIDDWSFWSTDTNVLQYTQASRDLITLGRCDGFYADGLFGICGSKTVRIVDNGYGTTTVFSVDQLYSDLTGTALSVEAAGFRGRVNLLNGQCEGITLSGHGLPGSSAVNFTSAANGGLLDIGTLRAERFGAYGINNLSNSLIGVGHHTYFSADGTLWNSPITPIRLIARESFSGGVIVGDEASAERTLSGHDTPVPEGSSGVSAPNFYKSADGSVRWRQS
jgi:hypothetical protein